MPPHAQRRETVGQAPAGFGRQQPFQRPFAQVHHVDRQAGVRQIVGELAADQPAAEHRDALFAFDGLAEDGVTSQIVHRQHGGRAVAGQAVRNRVGSQREHQLAVIERAAIGLHAPVLRVDRAHTGMREHRCLLVGRHVRRAGARQRGGRPARRKRVRQVGLGIKSAVIRGDERDRRMRVALADLLQQCVAGETRADDDDRMHKKLLTG